MRIRNWVALGAMGCCMTAQAKEMPRPMLIDRYHVTDAERVACQVDAVQFCSEAYPDEDKLLACMKQNKAQLTPVCRTTFEAGLRKRHLPVN